MKRDLVKYIIMITISVAIPIIVLIVGVNKHINSENNTMEDMKSKQLQTRYNNIALHIIHTDYDYRNLPDSIKMILVDKFCDSCVRMADSGYSNCYFMLFDTNGKIEIKRGFKGNMETQPKMQLK